MGDAKSGPDTGREFDRVACMEEIVAGMGLLNLSLRYSTEADFTDDEFDEMFGAFMEATSKRALYSILLTTYHRIVGGSNLLAWLTTTYAAQAARGADAD